MKIASQKSMSLAPPLLEIEKHFQKRETKLALSALERLEHGEFETEGVNKGFYLLLSAERAYYKNDYHSLISLCQNALSILGSTSFNVRIGRLQYLLYLAHSALGDLKSAEQTARDSLSSNRRINDEKGIVNAYNALGKIYFLRSDYAISAEYVNEAIHFAGSDPVQKAQLLGNLGRIYLLTGEMENAQSNLELALAIGREHDMPRSMARNHLSLGYLHMRRRHFYQAEMDLKAAFQIIRELDMSREFIIYLEYLGELCLEKQDFVTARKHLNEAVTLGRELAPESTLLSQCLRRLAQAELELGHQDQAMRQAQKALDLSQQLGEKIEIGLSHRVISAVFLSRNELADSRRHGLEGIETLRQIGDAYELGRSLVAYGEIPSAGVTLSDRKTLPLLREAEKIFTLLDDEYYLALCHFEIGKSCHNFGKNGDALEYLKEAVKGFRSCGEREGVTAVNEFLQSLSLSAVERALSEKNEYKIFGNYITDSEYADLKSGPLDHLLNILVNRTNADRAFIINYNHGDKAEISAAFGIEESDYCRISSGMDELISDDIITDRPILLLDCTNEVNFSGVVPEDNGGLASLLILPLVLSSDVVGYIYLDRLAHNSGKGINPFTQQEIDFAVGFADLAAFKTADYQKEKLLEDNVRLKAQLLEKCVFPNIITQSRQFMETLARIRQVSNSNMAISISGETGAGKDLLTKAIHYNSNRRDKRFISVNCAALPESLLESELFGYKKGAFTGADRDKPGLFEEADGGTFFLDEIADMPLSIQAKVLRLLENQEITRLGDTHPRKVDVRVLSATNKDLKVEMEEKRFRSDLFYRLCALHFTISPLRERKEDIPLLVDHFLEESNCRIMPDTMKYLIDYEWPGNVRELENEVKKLVLLANNDGPITPSLLSSRILGEDQQSVVAEPDETAFYSKDGFSLYAYMAEFEKRFIVKALKEQRGIKKRAADSLQIPESTLRLKLKQYDIDPKRLDVN
ncbi:MAG: sigma 54-interacting transcriptional regulator [candidate division Zixibacteria bacterium]|nr:sigma 54-interacting transcriptional regulator [candidate division Zixibacteria bacterium]